MPRVSAAYAEIDPDQATEALQVLALHARWEELRDSQVGGMPPPARLRELQNAFEAYRGRRAGYAARHRGELAVPLRPRPAGDLVPGGRDDRPPVQVECPADVVAKANRMAARIATRAGVAARDPCGPGLDAVIGWCEGAAAGREAMAAP